MTEQVLHESYRHSSPLGATASAHHGGVADGTVVEGIDGERTELHAAPMPPGE
jgi:hypothetical protein